MKISDIRRKKKFHTELAASEYQGFVHYSLDGMLVTGPDPFDSEKPFRIECRVDRIVLTGLYSYNEIINALGRLWIDPKFDPEERRSVYRNKAVKKVNNFIITVHFNPMANRPACKLIIDPQGDVSIKEYKPLLKWIDSGLPDLKASSVEYANDQFCRNPRAVENLFRVEMRHLFVPRQRSMGLYGDKIAKWGEKTRMNAVFRIGKEKLYERGPDGMKNGKGWSHEDVDRVRLEHTATRKELLKKGIDRLGDLIAHTRFYEVNKPIYGFKHFHKSTSLPHPWEAYLVPDEDVEPDSFQALQIFYRKEITNIGQCVADTHEFIPLLNRLHEIWGEFDKEWRAI